MKTNPRSEREFRILEGICMPLNTKYDAERVELEKRLETAKARLEEVKSELEANPRYVELREQWKIICRHKGPHADPRAVERAVQELREFEDMSRAAEAAVRRAEEALSNLVYLKESEIGDACLAAGMREGFRRGIRHMASLLVALDDDALADALIAQLAEQ